MDAWDFTGIAALITSLVLLFNTWWSRRKTEAERHKTEADSDVSEASAAETYQRIADRAAERALDLDEKIEQIKADFMARMEQRDKIITEQAAMIRQQAAVIADLQDWAERLAHQVRSLGGTPVEMRLSPKTKKDTGELAK